MIFMQYQVIKCPVRIDYAEMCQLKCSYWLEFGQFRVFTQQAEKRQQVSIFFTRLTSVTVFS